LINPVLWLLALHYPLCGTAGAAGVPAPGVQDFAHLHRLGHSEVFAAPAGFLPAPDIVTPVFGVPPDVLFAQVQNVAALQPRTYALDIEPQARQAAWVVRSAFANFPDVVEVEVVPEPDGKSGLVFYAHAVYGASDYGVNRKHAMRWLQDLQVKVAG
jgi:uncharacterized protein (DUF1499 family)